MRPSTPLHNIKGVGDKTWQKLQTAGLETVADLIAFLPRAYEDYTQVSQIDQLEPGNVVLRGKISQVNARYVRRGLHITSAVLSDSTGKVPITWFNQPYRAKHIQSSGEWLVAGEFALSQRRYQILNPSVRHSDEIIEAGGQSVIPIYRQVAGLKTQQIRSIIEEIRPIIVMLPEILPEELVRHVKLLSYADAMTALHFPESSSDIEAGRARVAFQEMIELLYASRLNRQDNATLKGYKIAFDLKATKSFVSQLPFQLTDDQRLSAWEIIQSFQAGPPMNRLLQGDVGSGKTIVAGLCALVVAKAGYQSAIMAPTELLAKQHAETLSTLLEPFGVTVGLLVGSLKAKAKDELKKQIAGGAIGVTVGTHALIQDSVKFDRLGFVVIDEQHRFGVKQRQQLLQKSKLLPHLLSMTATPIPRSLQLTAYGDLDVSLLRQKPADRLPIRTKIVSPVSQASLMQKIDQQIDKGRQVYVVCPLIDGEEAELRTVTSEYERLRKTALKHRRIGLLHGKLTAREKDVVMRRFMKKDYDVLVATTVVEVGVDVPNASLMVIQGAERFGLAQLHQLRGRVGRSQHQGYCYLIPTDARQTTNQRLRELEQSNDGFYLAERDLEIRGPGEIYGTAQHGSLNLQIASLSDMSLIRTVQSAIAYCQKNDINLLQYAEMEKRVDTYRRLTTLN